MDKAPDKELKGKSVVYYDGSCPMCVAFVGTVDQSSKKDKFILKDITKETALPEGLTREAVWKEMHVVVDGKVYKNASSILKILEEYPLWRPFVWIGRLPIIRSILPIGYNFIARHRHAIFRPNSRTYWLKVTGLSVVLIGLIIWLLS